jgi:hypothetical protein
MARWTASAKWAAGPALDGQRDMPLALSLSEWLGVIRYVRCVNITANATSSVVGLARYRSFERVGSSIGYGKNPTGVLVAFDIASLMTLRSPWAEPLLEVAPNLSRNG